VENIKENKKQIARRQIKPSLVRRVVASCNAHFKKYGLRKMALPELRKLCGV